MIGGLNESRSDLLRSFSSDAYQDIRSLLSDPANFGSSGVVRDTVEFAPDLNVITPGALAGLDIFILAEVTSLTTDEQDALRQFVLDGHGLVLISDTPDASTVGANLMLQQLGMGQISSDRSADDDTEGIFTNQTLSTDGPFGPLLGESFTVTRARRLISGFGSTVIGETQRDGIDILVEIRPGTLAPGSGAVLAMGDVLLTNSFIPIDGGDESGNKNNANLFMNFVSAHAAPEPASAAVLLIIATTFLPTTGRARRRRQAA